MIAQADLQHVNGVDVYAADGQKIGSAGRLYLDDRTGEPKWISVRSGMAGATESFVPVDEATLGDDRLVIPFDKDRVDGAPRIPAGGDLHPADEDMLRAYYDSRRRGVETHDHEENHLRTYSVTEQRSISP
ncbi:PRC-barrel domain-containing protein [Actinoplanes subtropicus]|uniref:PRC-barrel domain-containing protein n=1 Tax=Actinoplanes subtropicus TaxID=543632 RepID=UPI000691A51B|nr:PRC-barrel domain-containing protein [Actinoplanes subtropicus]